jgi:hypothetical protein
MPDCLSHLRASELLKAIAIEDVNFRSIYDIDDAHCS